MTGLADAYWLEQTEADVPTGDQWLSTEELQCLAELRFKKRRTDWRLGRWTAKHAVASYLKLPIDVDSQQEIEIRATASGAPRVYLFKQRANISLSLSHRAGHAFCVVGLSGATLGCDLELVESREHSFVTEFFTVNEQRLFDGAAADERAALATLVWSAKESALKALEVGLRLDTASLDVSFTEGTPDLQKHSRQQGRAVWSPLLLRRRGGQNLLGSWRCAEDLVRTVVFNPLRAGWER